MSDFKKLLIFPAEDEPVLKAMAEATGLSVNQLVLKCVHGYLPTVKAELSSRAARVTNIEPLPEAVLRQCYARPERDEAGVNRLIKRQPKGVRD